MRADPFTALIPPMAFVTIMSVVLGNTWTHTLTGIQCRRVAPVEHRIMTPHQEMFHANKAKTPLRAKGSFLSDSADTILNTLPACHQ